MSNNNDLVSNNRLCLLCGDHSTLVIALEYGGHIKTTPFPKHRLLGIESIIKSKKTMSLDLANLFWPPEEQDPTESVF
jgi:hypothetical protein